MDRLVSASVPGMAASYAYDAQGRRKSKTVNGATTLFVTTADNREVLEYDGASGAPQRWFSHGLGPNDALSQKNVAAGTRATFIPDLQGSIIATLDSATGAFSKAGYLPYGGSASTGGTFRYTGQRIDAESGLYYYRARAYRPAWGRFMQVDPIGYEGGINLYAYVGNDPLNVTDPSGNCPSCLVGALTSVALGYGIAAITGQEYTWKSALTDAALGAVGAGLVNKAVQFGQLSGLGLSVGQRLTATGSLASAPTEGTYVLRAAGSSYVGQSGDLATRSAASAIERGLTNAPVVRIGELGGKTSREVLEQRILNELGGVGAPGVLNAINPVGIARQGLLTNPQLGVISGIYAPGSSLGTSAAVGSAIGTTSAIPMK